MILIRELASASSANRPAPAGLEHRADAVPVEPPGVGRTTLWAIGDDAVPPGDTRRVRTLPPRNDLPASHPRRGQRLLAVVPSGCPDLCLDAAGRLVPAGPDGLPWVAPPIGGKPAAEPLEPAAAERGP